MQLTTHEARVIGCLLEKEATTPEQYPLTLHSLTNACNQNSNRNPVMALTQAEVREVLKGLQDNKLISEETGARVSKYRHRFCNTTFSDLQLSAQETAILCVLFLRGPQTPGELRARTLRMAGSADVSEIEGTLQAMITKEFVVRLPREAGRRESRYSHLFSGQVPLQESVSIDHRQADQARIEELEHEVKVLKLEIERLNQQLGH